MIDVTDVTGHPMELLRSMKERHEQKDRACHLFRSGSAKSGRFLTDLSFQFSNPPSRPTLLPVSRNVANRHLLIQRYSMPCI